MDWNEKAELAEKLAREITVGTAMVTVADELAAVGIVVLTGDVPGPRLCHLQEALKVRAAEFRALACMEGHLSRSHRLKVSLNDLMDLEGLEDLIVNTVNRGMDQARIPS